MCHCGRSHAKQDVAMSMRVLLSRGIVPAKRHGELLEAMTTHTRPNFHVLSGGGRRLPSLGEECLGIFGKRGKFQTYACYFGVQGLTDDHLGINVREWWLPWWLEGEPDIGIGCDLPLNRGLGVVRPGETEQGARSGGLRDHFALNEKTGHGQRRCQRHEGFRRLFWQC